MKRSCHFALAVSLLLLPAALVAQTVPASKPAPKTTADEDQIFRYNSAVGLLKKGRDFERAIVLLRVLTEQNPQDRACRLALGCAYACRIAALGDAMAHPLVFEEDQEKYQNWLAAWGAAQNTPSDPKYHQPAPKPPMRTMRDDDKPFTLTLEAVLKRYLETVALPQADWDKALALSKTPEERAEALYTQGWGRRMARKYSHQIIKEDDPPKETGGPLPTEKQIIQNFTEATKSCPKNARFWQSLGDARRGENWYKQDNPDSAPAVAAYETSLKLNRSNPSLWFRVYQIVRRTDPALALKAMRQAAKEDGDNAYLSYRLAGALLSETRAGSYEKPLKITGVLEGSEAAIKSTPRVTEAEENKRKSEEALSLMERSNKMPRYKPMAYVSAAPDLLAAAWDFQPDYAEFNYGLDELTALDTLLQDYVKARLKENNIVEAQRAADALIGMGRLRLTAGMNEFSLKAVDLIWVLAAMSNVEVGYALVQEICRATDDAPAAEQAKADYEVLRDQYVAFRKAQKEARAARYYY